MYNYQRRKYCVSAKQHLCFHLIFCILFCSHLLLYCIYNSTTCTLNVFNIMRHYLKNGLKLTFKFRIYHRHMFFNTNIFHNFLMKVFNYTTTIVKFGAY